MPFDRLPFRNYFKETQEWIAVNDNDVGRYRFNRLSQELHGKMRESHDPRDRSRVKDLTIGPVRAASVCLIGSFPHVPSGPEVVHELFRRMAQEKGAIVNTIDLSPLAGPNMLPRRLAKIAKVMVGVPKFCFLLALRRADAVYIGMAGGYGQIYDLAFVVLVRLSGSRLFVHHDSYAYLDKRRRLTAALVRIAGSSAVHIVLCEDMKARLINQYSQATAVVVISGATNIESPTDVPQSRSKLRVIGFISHLSRPKGVLEFLEVADRVCRSQIDFRAQLAGAIAEPSLGPIIQEWVKRASWLTYLGPIPAEAKSRFYADIDVLVFPTRYANEADPAVINEALAHGVVVITRGRGCIESVVARGGGSVIPNAANFVAEAEKLLLTWYLDSDLFSKMSLEALTNSERMRNEHRARLSELITKLTSVRSTASRSGNLT